MIKNNSLYPKIQKNLKRLGENGFSEISNSRKELLDSLRSIIADQNEGRDVVKLNFICTHNSRRSHISQLLAYASCFFSLDEGEARRFNFFSGGTEATAFHPNSIKALREFGFMIEAMDGNANNLQVDRNKGNQDILPYRSSDSNPLYRVQISDTVPFLYAFSKKYGDPPNPSSEYIAIMTCDHAAENCPVVFGADSKFNLTYKDPKLSDGSSEQDRIYRERVEEIGREMLYLFR